MYFYAAWLHKRGLRIIWKYTIASVQSLHQIYVFTKIHQNRIRSKSVKTEAFEKKLFLVYNTEVTADNYLRKINNISICDQCNKQKYGLLNFIHIRQWNTLSMVMFKSRLYNEGHDLFMVSAISSKTWEFEPYNKRDNNESNVILRQLDRNSGITATAFWVQAFTSFKY